MLTELPAASTDPGLLKARTTFKQYSTLSGHVYPRIRTFYNEHTQASKLPADLPLIVLIHGLGGSAAQFAPLLNSLTQIAPCLAIDLPGCGLSDFKPDDIEAYTTTAFAELLHVAIDEHRNKEANQKVVLIGHSMGCSIAALLASSSSPLHHLCADTIISLIAICPRSRGISEEEMRGIRRVSYLPSFVFDLLRMADRRGGVDSVSVTRVIGKEADLETKKLQLRYNQQSKSAVFQVSVVARRHLQLAKGLSETSLYLLLTTFGRESRRRWLDKRLGRLRKGTRVSSAGKPGMASRFHCFSWQEKTTSWLRLQRLSRSRNG